MTDNTEIILAAKKNKRRASFAMWASAFFLIAVTLVAYFCEMGIAAVFFKYGNSIEKAIVHLLSFFGAGKQDAYTAAKYLLSSTAFSYFLSIITSFVSLVIPAFVFSKIVGVKPDESFRINGRTVSAFVPVFCLCHLFTTLASVFSGVISDFMLPGTAEIYESYTGVVSQSFNVYEFIVSALCAAVFVPLVEEYVFRGVLYSYLKRYGITFGVIASAVIFGIAHTSPTQSVYAFVFGIFSALLFEVTGNIKTSVIFHGINNFITVALGYIMGAVSTQTFNLISSTYMLVFSGFGVYGIYALCRKGGIVDTFREKEEENDGGLCEKAGLAQIIVLPLVIYLGYYVYSVIRTVM